MPAPVTVVNRALSLIGARCDIQSFDEVSPQAEAAKLWYAEVRDQVLAAAHWSFAKRQATLARRPVSTQRPWTYMYSVPEDCLWPRYLGDGSAPVPFSPGHSPEGPVILTDMEDAYLTYTARIEDLNYWTPAAIQALTYALGGNLCMPLSGDMQKYRVMLQQANAILLDARTRDANQEPMTLAQHVPDWLAIRGVGETGSVTNMNPSSFGELFAVPGDALVND